MDKPKRSETLVWAGSQMNVLCNSRLTRERNSITEINAELNLHDSVSMSTIRAPPKLLLIKTKRERAGAASFKCN